MIFLLSRINKDWLEVRLAEKEEAKSQMKPGGRIGIREWGGSREGPREEVPSEDSSGDLGR